MSGKGGFFIMLLIVAFLSLALAVMAGLFFFTSDTDKNGDEKVEKKEVKAPKESELATFLIEKKAYNLKDMPNSDTQSFIQITAELKYFKTIASIKDLKTEEKITLNQAAILEMFGNYFQGITIEDIKAENARDKAKKYFINKINDYLVANEEYKVKIVYTIHFSEWLYQ